MVSVKFWPLLLNHHLGEQPMITFLAPSEAIGYLLQQFSLLILSTMILVFIIIFIYFLSIAATLAFSGVIISLFVSMTLVAIGPEISHFFPISYAFLGFDNNLSFLQSIVIMSLMIVMFYVLCWVTFYRRKEALIGFS